MKGKIALLLSILMILALFLFSCNVSENEKESESATDTATATETEAEAVEYNPAVFVENSVTKLKNIVYTADYNEDLGDTLYKFVRKFNNIIADTGADEFVHLVKAEELVPDKDALEIIIGNIDAYEECATAYASIPADCYGLVPVNNKIVFVYRNEYQLFKLKEQLWTLLDFEDYKHGAIILPDEFFIVSEHDPETDNCPYLDGYTDVGYIDRAENGFGFVFHDADMDGFERYIGIIEDAGYTLNGESNFGGYVISRTFVNDEHKITLNYLSVPKEIRITYDERTPDQLPEEEKEAVTEPSLTMCGLDYYKSTGEEAANGLCLFFRLSDGRFIIIDGGFNNKKNAKMIINTMRDLAKDYLAEGEEPVVAAWIVTHAHSDHLGALIKKYQMFIDAGVKVESIVASCISDEEKSRSIEAALAVDLDEDVGSFTEKEIKTYEKELRTVADAFGATYYIARTGEVYNFGDCKIEMLYTPELYGEKLLNVMNSTSMIMKFTFGGNTMLIIGDSSGNALNYTCDLYGDYIKCDMINTLHHGIYPSAEDDAYEAYSKIQPTLVLWDCGFSWTDHYDAKQNQGWHDTSNNPNFKEYYVAGWQGDRITIPLPYTVGNVEVTRVEAPDPPETTN